MEIYLVRHTETVCDKGICYGQSDVGIREPYMPLFESIAQQLPKEAVLYSSPLKRCVFLAQYIQSTNTIGSLHIDQRLMEMHFGDWELRYWNEIPRDDLDPWMEDFVRKNTPNGESFVELHQRVSEFLDQLLLLQCQKPKVIVTHSGVIRSIGCSLNNIPLKEAFVDQIDFGAVLKMNI